MFLRKIYRSFPCYPYIELGKLGSPTSKHIYSHSRLNHTDFRPPIRRNHFFPSEFFIRINNTIHLFTFNFFIRIYIINQFITLRFLPRICRIGHYFIVVIPMILEMAMRTIIRILVIFNIL